MTARGDSLPLRVKVSTPGMEALDSIAAELGADRSTVVRGLLADGAAAYRARGAGPGLRAQLARYAAQNRR